MCPEHATYCYPNGCLKKVPGKKSDASRLFQIVPHVHTIKDKGQMTFLVDPQKDFLENFMDSKSVSEKEEKVNDRQNKICKSLILTALVILFFCISKSTYEDAVFLCTYYYLFSLNMLWKF